MKKLLIVGAGSFAPEVEEMARLVGYDEIDFLDDNPRGSMCMPVIGVMADIEKWRGEYDEAIVALGNNDNRLKFTSELERCGYTIPSLVHPMAYVSPDAVLGAGCIVRAMCVVGRYVELGKACILHMGAKVDHHCVIGEGSHLLVNSVVRGMKELPDRSRVESGVVVQ